MMSRHIRMSSELSGAIAKNQLSVPGSFFNQFVTDIYIIRICPDSSKLVHNFKYCNKQPLI